MANLLDWVGFAGKEIDRRLPGDQSGLWKPLQRSQPQARPQAPQRPQPQQAPLQQAARFVGNAITNQFDRGGIARNVAAPVLERAPWMYQGIKNNAQFLKNPVTKFIDDNIVEPMVKTQGNVGQLAQGKNPYQGTAKQVAGQIGEDALNVASILPVGAGVRVLKSSTPLMTKAIDGAKTGAKYGLPYGAGYGAAEAAQQDASTQEIFKGAAVGGAAGAALGAGLGFATPIATKGATVAVQRTNRAIQEQAREMQERTLRAAEEASGLSRLNVLNDNEMYTLTDFAEVLASRHDRNRPQFPIDLQNQIIRQAYNAAETAGIDVRTGTTKEIVERITAYNEAREAFKYNQQLAKEGGYIAGPNAKGFDDALKAGKVFDGVDGKQRFEVDDSTAKIKDLDGRTLGEVLDHPQLFKQYPNLKNTPIGRQVLRDEENGIAFDDGRIIFNKNLDPESAKGTILHELQHVIQKQEGFATGASVGGNTRKLTPAELKEKKALMDAWSKDPENAEKYLAKINEIDNRVSGFTKYSRSAGEAEARAVQARMNMPMSERYVKPSTSSKFVGGNVPDKQTRAFAMLDGDMEAAGYSNHHGVWVDNALDTDFVNRLTPENVATLKAQGITHIEKAPTKTGIEYGNRRVGNESHGVIKVSDENQFKHTTSLDFQFYHESGHHVWSQKMSPEDKAAFSRLNPEKTSTHKAHEHAGHEGGEMDSESFSDYLAMELQGKGDQIPVEVRPIVQKYAARPDVRSTFYDSLDVPKDELIVRNSDGVAMSIDDAKAYAAEVNDPNDIVDELTDYHFAAQKSAQNEESLLQKVKRYGGISSSDFESLPSQFKNKNGIGMDKMAQELGFESDQALMNAIEGYETAGKQTKAQIREDVIKQLNAGGGDLIFDEDLATAYQLAKERQSAFDYLGDVKRPEPSKERQRGFVTSVKNSDEVSTQTKRKTKGTYTVRSTEKLRADAEKYAEGDSRETLERLYEELSVPVGEISDETVAKTIAVAKKLDAEGNTQDATNLYESLAEHGTAQGQSIQAFSLLSNRTPEGMRFHAQRVLKKAGVELDEAKQKELADLTDAVRKTEPDTTARNMATHDIMQFINRNTPTGFFDKVINVWRAGLLTAPTTTGGNLLGNTTEAMTRNIWVNPVAAAADAVMSLKTGKRTKTLAGGQKEGVKEGIDKLGTYLKTGYDERNSLSKYDAREIDFGPSTGGRALTKYVNSVYRLMSAADQPFYYAGKNQAKRDLAQADAKNLNLTGAQRNDYIAKAVGDPDWKPQTFKTKNTDKAAAEYGVYQNKTAIGQFVSGGKQRARQTNEFAGAVADYIMPFTQVPSAIAMRVIDRTPIGIAREVVNQIKSGKFDQRAMAESIGNGTFGPLVIGAGFALASQGEITGAYPTDRKEQELWRMEGKQPFSVRVGDRWYSLNYMQPFGTILAMGAQVKDAQDRGEDGMTALFEMAGAGGQAILNQSFLKGVAGSLNAIQDPKRYAESFVENTAGSIMPNFIRSAARAVDPQQRDVEGPLEAFLASIPGIRQTLPAKQDAFGRNLDDVDNPVNQFTNPLRPSKIKDDDTTVNELRRLQDTDNGIIPTQFNKATFKDVEITPEQLRKLQADYGAKVYANWTATMATPEYAAASDEDKAKMLRGTMEDISRIVKDEFRKNNGIATSNKTTSSAPSKKLSDLPKGMNGYDVATLERFDGMNETDRKKVYNNEPDAEYKHELAKLERDKKLGTLSDAEKIKREKTVARLDVGKTTPKAVREMYGLSKSDVLDYVSNHPDGNRIAQQLVAYDDALYAAGLISKTKFRLSSGAVSIGPAQRGGSRGGRRSSGGSRRTAGGRSRGSNIFRAPRTSSGGVSATNNLAALRKLVTNAKVQRRTVS